MPDFVDRMRLSILPFALSGMPADSGALSGDATNGMAR
jgi:hypothetical protein